MLNLFFVPFADDKSIKLEAENKDLFDLEKHSNKELCHFKYLLLNFTATVVSGQKFIEQVCGILMS